MSDKALHAVNDLVLIDKLEKQIKNLETMNKEMYENHKVAIAKLEAQVTDLYDIHRIKTNQLGDDNFALETKIAALEDPDFKGFIKMATKWMEKYPPDIFDGSSGDSGPLFVVAIRNAIAGLK